MDADRRAEVLTTSETFDIPVRATIERGIRGFVMNTSGQMHGMPGAVFAFNTADELGEFVAAMWSEPTPLRDSD